MTNEQLIQAFARTCAASGVANSGLVVDVMGPIHASEARYLKSVLLARLEGQKPPFNRRDLVESKSLQAVWSADGARFSATPGPHEIFRVHYEGNGKWFLEFKDIPEGRLEAPRFPAEEFVLVCAATAA